VMDRPVVDTCSEDASALGAALLARIATGHAELDDVPACHSDASHAQPIPAHHAIYRRSCRHFATLIARAVL